MAKSITNSSHPVVSVVMAVYNCEAYVREAVDSILAQTFSAFEFIIINDGSTDDTLDILKSYDDPRIRLTTRKNKGLVASLNEGIDLARGEFIARQDADDRSAPERLELQVKRARKTKCEVIGTAFAFIGLDGRVVGRQACYEDNENIQAQLRVSNPFGHGSILMQRKAVLKVGGYLKSVGPVEDYDLWLRLAPVVRFAGINQVLYYWRINPAGISHQHTAEQTASAEALKRAYNDTFDWRPASIGDICAQYYRRALSGQSLNRLLAKQMIRERFHYGMIPQSDMQKVKTVLTTALLQPGAVLFFVRVVAMKVLNKIRYIAGHGGRA